MSGTAFEKSGRPAERLSELLLNESFLPEAVTRLVLLSVTGFGTHGLVVGAAMYGSHAPGLNGWVFLWLPFALAMVFPGALCVCIPSFYFDAPRPGVRRRSRRRWRRWSVARSKTR